MQLPTQTLIQSLASIAEKNKQQTAFLSGEQSISFAELIQRIAATQHRLLNCGIKKGDRVLIIGSNHADFAVIYFAIHSVRAIAVPVDVNLKSVELDSIIQDSTPSLLVSETKNNLNIHQESLASFTHSNNSSYSLELMVSLEDAADILYTTGTTAKKKGVLLSHNNIAASALNISSYINNSKSDIELVPIPLSHSFGLGRLRSMALVGNTLVLEPGLKNPAILLKRILELQANGLALVPAGFELILRLTRDKLAEAQDHLRYIEIGSASMRDETRQRLMQLLPKTRLCHHYGLTEASRSCFKEYHTDFHKPLSIGKPSPNVQISIVDKKGAAVANNDFGEIIVYGAMTMNKYWNRPDLDSESFYKEGLRTGDLGKTDKEGYIYLQGRKHELINVGGLKVTPLEIESCVLAHQTITDCACVGIPDPITGEKIKLFYVANEEIDPLILINQLRLQLEEYKIPKLYERIKSIPKTDSGKIIRHALL